MKWIISAAAAIAIAVVAPSPANAQVGATTDIIMGRVVGPDSLPLAGARIEVTSQETGVTRRRSTDQDGRYTIVFPDGGGTYRVSITYLGMAPARLTVARQGDEDRLEANAVLGRVATQLAAIEVRGRQTQLRIQMPEAGNTERGLPPGLVNRMPIEASDFNALATLAPGVIGIPGTDSTRASFSVAGQPADQNSITLDGLSFGSGSVPQEAIRGTRVVTNTYDVARGQFTGGQVTSTTRGGTNEFQGALNYSLRDPSLEFVDDPGGFTQKYRQSQLSAGFGGPIVKDKLFVYGAGQYNRRTDDVLSLLAADPLTLQRLGTNTDSVARFLSLLDQFGLPASLAAPSGNRVANNGSALVRLDYNLADSHTLMARGDWRWSSQEPSRVSPFGVPHSGGNTSGRGGGAMVTLTSHFGKYINELRGYAAADNRDVTSYLTVPDGRVTVASVLEDGTQSIASLQFGGNPSLPQETRTSLFEMSDEFSRVTRTGAHRFKIGGLVNEEHSSAGFIPNRWGTFSFNSLEDFEAGRPTTFTRTLSALDRESATRNVALYVGDSWRRTPTLQFVYGLRIEGSQYPNAPERNAEIETLFGRRTDRFPGEVRLSPRAGFTYNVFPEIGGPPTFTVRGGFGEFRGRASSQLFAGARNATGLAGGQTLLTCIGSAVPTPDWDAYLADPSSIPSICAGGLPGVPVGQRRDVTVFDPAFAAPRAWRGSLGVVKRFAERFTLSVDASYARGVSQSASRDINLDTVPEFALADEAGRPVYVPATSIVAATGATSLNASRIHSQYGRVTELMSELESDTKQLTTSFNGFLLRGVQFNLSYTFTNSRDQAQGFSSASAGGFAGGFIGGFGGGFGGGGSTAGNPNRPEWGTSEIARRHSVLATVNYTVRPGINLSIIGRAVSGSRYSPTVGGDINGDGLRNDRAFVFDPASAADRAVADGMARLLAGAPKRARECLTDQRGQIASRNSCATGWTPSLDLQLNFQPASFGLDRRLTVSVLALNTLTGLDQLLHGSGNLRGWGQQQFADRTLLYVRGFDPASRSYRYQVNENFGSSGQRNAFRVPFQIAFQARLAVGNDPARNQFRQVIAGGPGGQRATPEELRQRMARSVPNAFREILAVNDSLQLALTPEQTRLLTAAGDSFQVKADTLVAAIANLLGGADRNAEPMRIGQQLQPRIREGRELAVQAVRDAQKILTAEQWAKLPPRIKQPFRPGAGGQGGPGMMIIGGPPE